MTFRSCLLRLKTSKLFVFLALILVQASIDLLLFRPTAQTTTHPFAVNKAGVMKSQEEIVLPLSLPTMNVTGGVVFYYHMQKTGGVTIRKAISRQDHRRVKFTRIPPELEGFVECSDIVHQHLQGNITNTRVHFLEHHGGGESILDMVPHFEKWHRASRSTGIPLFIFTLLREPAAHAISHFNFFHVPPGTPPYDHDLHEPTEFNLRTHATSEHQLRMLAHGGEGRSLLDVDFDDEWENKTLDVLQTYFGWIGATEQLSQVTLPLLGWLVVGDAKALLRIRPKNVGARRHNVRQLSSHDISNKTLSYLESINQRVRRLWERHAWFSAQGLMDV